MQKEPLDNSVTDRICKVVIFGTLFIVSAITGLLILGDKNTYTVYCLFTSVVAFLYIASAYWLLRRNYYRIVAYLLVLFYILVASSIVIAWGISTPMGLLFFALVIILAGILLTARVALFAAVLSGLILVGLQTTIVLQWYQPNTSWMASEPSYGDAFAYSAMFIMIALISWLYNQEMERSLSKVKQTETALLQQKATLKLRVKERTRDLRRVQLQEMRQMYNFASLGQLGITLLHDLANHLTVLTISIEGLKDKQYSKELAPAYQTIHYISDMIESTRRRLNGETQQRTFDVVRKISETVDFLYYKAAQNSVDIVWEPPVKSWQYTGDPESFGQIIAILTNNAIDAYSNFTSANQPRVVVTLETKGSHMTIRINDWGKGISKSWRKKLFTPHHSSKKSGLGLGLYIAKQIVEMQFLGTIVLRPVGDHTEFVVKLPLGNEK
jgi:signal transduction histidine kinase